MRRDKPSVSPSQRLVALGMRARTNALGVAARAATAAGWLGLTAVGAHAMASRFHAGGGSGASSDAAHTRRQRGQWHHLRGASSSRRRRRTSRLCTVRIRTHTHTHTVAHAASDSSPHHTSASYFEAWWPSASRRGFLKWEHLFSFASCCCCCSTAAAAAAAAAFRAVSWGRCRGRGDHDGRPASRPGVCNGRRRQGSHPCSRAPTLRAPQPAGLNSASIDRSEQRCCHLFCLNCCWNSLLAELFNSKHSQS
jgi:hypothetical protein